MRRMRALAVMFLVGVLAVRASAGDDAAGGQKVKDVTVFSEEDWLQKVKDISKVDTVGVKRTDVLTRQAAKSVIRMRVKIFDIRTTREGLAIDIVDVSPCRARADAAALPRDPILLPAEDGPAVGEWKKWDRIVFKVKPKVLPDGALQYTRLVSGAADLDRIPNPGIEYVPSDRPLAKTDAFGDWVDRYSRACCTPDWRTAWKMYSHANDLWFPVSAKVRAVAAEFAGGRAHRGPCSVTFDFTGSTGVTGYGYVDAQGHPQTWAQVVVEDPQIGETLVAGARAELRLRILGLEKREDLELREGRFRVEVAFGRVK